MIPRLFRKRPAPIPPQPAFEKDWAVGDRAECIAPDEGRWFSIRHALSPSNGPRRGEICRVVHLFCDSASLWLCFGAFPGSSFPAGHFRKLRPCSTDFREQLHKLAPAGPDGRTTKAPPVPAIKEPELVP